MQQQQHSSSRDRPGRADKLFNCGLARQVGGAARRAVQMRAQTGTSCRADSTSPQVLFLVWRARCDGRTRQNRQNRWVAVAAADVAVAVAVAAGGGDVID